MLLSVGTSLHPANENPFSDITFSIIFIEDFLLLSSTLRKNIPIAKFFAMFIFSSFAIDLKKNSGILKSIPHPSPDVPSAPTAPLCASLSSAVIAVLISQ